MTDSRIMNDTTNTKTDFPFVIEGEGILSTLNLTTEDIILMFEGGDWCEAYAGEDPAETKRKLVGTTKVVTQVATTTDGSLAFGLIGTRGNINACITYVPGGWRKITAAKFWEENGTLWMKGGIFDPPIRVDSSSA